MENKALNIPTIHESLRRDVLAGILTIEQAAEEFHVAGWLPYIDEEETARRIELTATKLAFLVYPCRVVVCESCDTPNSTDRETNDLREYARITPRTSEIGGIWLTRFEFAGTIEWSKHAWMLTPEQRAAIENEAAKYAEADKEHTKQAKALQEYQRGKYAAQIAKYGE